jgi:hypothetical protein
VWVEEKSHHLVFTQRIGEQSTLLYSSSSDGLNWSTPQEVLSTVGEDIEANSHDAGTLWLSREDSNGWNIYTTEVGVWESPITPEIERGDIGTWDDNGLKDAFIERVEGKRNIYYSGFDGFSWQIGVAEEVEDQWIRFENDDVPTPILGTSGLFYSEEVGRLLRIPNTSSFYFSGTHDDTSRVGMATEFIYGHLRTHYNLPKMGDALSFETQQGTDDELSIPLDVSVNGITLTGNGLAQLSIDSERGFLFASSRLLPYIVVIDIRDDSNENFIDRNYSNWKPHSHLSPHQVPQVFGKQLLMMVFCMQ